MSALQGIRLTLRGAKNIPEGNVLKFGHFFQKNEMKFFVLNELLVI